MLDTLATLFVFASEAGGHEEPSKTAFYVAGGVLAGWAVLLSLYGMRKADWPGSDGPARGVMGVTVILMLGTMAAAIATG